MARAGQSAAWPFLAGLAAGVGVAAAWGSLGRRRRLDPRIVRALPRAQKAPMMVFVPGLLGSQLLRPDGSVAWLNLGNTLGHHDLSLPRRCRSTSSRDELVPGLPDRHGLGAAARLRLHRVRGPARAARRRRLRAGRSAPACATPSTPTTGGATWSSPRAGLARRLEGLADAMGEPDARFHLVGHSMGGLVVRWYLRYGGAEPSPKRQGDLGGRPARGERRPDGDAQCRQHRRARRHPGRRARGAVAHDARCVGGQPDAVGLPAAAARGSEGARRREGRRGGRRPARSRHLGALGLGALRLPRPADARSRRSASSSKPRSSVPVPSTTGSCASPAAGPRSRCTRSAGTAC